MKPASPENYKTKARAAISDPVLQKALDNLQARLGRGAAAAYQRLPEGPQLRKKAHAASHGVASVRSRLVGSWRRVVVGPSMSLLLIVCHCGSRIDDSVSMFRVYPR